MRTYLVLIIAIALAGCDMKNKFGGDKTGGGKSGTPSDLICSRNLIFPPTAPRCRYPDGSVVPSPSPVGDVVVSSIENSLALQQWAEGLAEERIPSITSSFHPECEQLLGDEYDFQPSDVRVVLRLNQADAVNSIIRNKDASANILSAKKEIAYGHQNIKDNLLEHYKAAKVAKHVKNNSDMCNMICNELLTLVQVHILHEEGSCLIGGDIESAYHEIVTCLSATWVTGSAYPREPWFGEVRDRCELKLKYAP